MNKNYEEFIYINQSNHFSSLEEIPRTSKKMKDFLMSHVGFCLLDDTLTQTVCIFSTISGLQLDALFILAKIVERFSNILMTSIKIRLQSFTESNEMDHVIVLVFRRLERDINPVRLIDIFIQCINETIPSRINKITSSSHFSKILIEIYNLIVSQNNILLPRFNQILKYCCESSPSQEVEHILHLFIDLKMAFFNNSDIAS